MSLSLLIIQLLNSATRIHVLFMNRAHSTGFLTYESSIRTPEVYRINSKQNKKKAS